jgi:predicted DNA-binding transcriptional regulator AlpA
MHTLSDRYLTERQAAEITGLSVSFFQRARWQGSGPPFVRVSARAIRYKESALRDWMEQRTKRSTSEA